MTRVSRWPLAVVCMGLGAVGAMVATERSQGQPTIPPPPAGQLLPAPAPVAPAIPKELSSYRDVVKRVLPAVVNIEAKSLEHKPAARRALPPGVPEEFRRFFEADEAAPADPNLGFGSGVLVDPSGIVLTAFHVVDGADTVEVQLHDGRKFTSKDIRRDPKTDLAIIKLTSDQPLPALTFGDSDAMEVGDRVLAVGAPFGLSGSVTHGIISAKSRQNLKLNQYEDFLQTDAAINPGNSGGPLISLDGHLIGINSAIKTRSGGFQGVGLAISSNMARDVAAQLANGGVVKRGFLGVAIREVDDAIAARLGLAKGTGVIVARVYADSPAAKAGLQTGDVITSIGGTVVKEANTLPRIVARLPIGMPAEVLYVRDGKQIAQMVTVEEQPDDVKSRPLTSPANPAKPRGVMLEQLGLSVGDLTADTAARLGFPRTVRGAVVVSVTPKGAAAEAGLVPGRVVVKVDKTPVTSAQEFADAVAAAPADRGALLFLLRPSGEVDFAVLKVK